MPADEIVVLHQQIVAAIVHPHQLRGLRPRLIAYFVEQPMASMFDWQCPEQNRQGGFGERHRTRRCWHL